MLNKFRGMEVSVGFKIPLLVRMFTKGGETLQTKRAPFQRRGGRGEP